jgi:hypothetical protein
MRDATVEVGEGKLRVQLYGSCVVGDGQLVPPGVEVGVAASPIVVAAVTEAYWLGAEALTRSVGGIMRWPRCGPCSR